MGSSGSARSIAILACVAILAGACDSTKPSPAPSTAKAPTGPATAAPTASSEPASSTAPDDTSGTSSQALIEADLESGAITLPQSLLYRAWAGFWDPRLPERYDGSGSIGEDNELFDDIAAALPTLTPDQQAELKPYLLRPSDPASAWSGATTADAGGGIVLAAATTTAPAKCTLPSKWYPQDWSPDGNRDRGFRAWACDEDKAVAEQVDNDVLAIAQKLWRPMTQAEPNGMGKPVPDSGLDLANGGGDGNGKVDIYVLDPLAQCRDRGGRCDAITGRVMAAAAMDYPSLCGVIGFPDKGCSGYIIVPRADLHDNAFPGTLAHEFFHVLQDSHNGPIKSGWYTEASATWAEFHYVGDSGLFGGAIKAASRDDGLPRAKAYLRNKTSLLHYGPGLPDQYTAWVWPLFQQSEAGPQAVFGSWQAMETADTTDEYDVAIESTLHFQDHFRDFAVRDAQPAPYRFGASTGLEADYWPTHLNLTDFPKDPRHTHGTWRPLTPGKTLVVTSIEASDAQYDGFSSIPDNVRQITIDLSGLHNDAFADLDVLGELTPTEDQVLSLSPEWKRIKASGGHVVLCRDQPAQNLDQFEVVVSNHENGRTPDGKKPSPLLTVSGSYTIDATDKCQVPDHFSGSFSGTNGIDGWHGTATFDRTEPDALGGGCSASSGEALYCYTIASGSVTWTSDGVTRTFSLAPPDAADGIQLIVSDSTNPNRAGSYEIGLTPSTDIHLDSPHGKRYAFETVFSWISVIQYPKYPPDWHLSGTESTGGGCGIDGCGTGATWSWNLTATFDP